jgi:hypothetical protein
MTIAALRVQIDRPTYLQLDGQWQVVLPGSVIDLPTGLTLSPSCILASFVESPGNLASHGKPTPVRNIRTA